MGGHHSPHPSHFPILRKASLRATLTCGRGQSQQMAKKPSQSPDHSVPEANPTSLLPTCEISFFVVQGRFSITCIPSSFGHLCVSPSLGDLARHSSGLRFLLLGGPWFFRSWASAAQHTLFPGDNSVLFMSLRFPTLPCLCHSG